MLKCREQNKINYVINKLNVTFLIKIYRELISSWN